MTSENKTTNKKQSAGQTKTENRARSAQAKAEERKERATETSAARASRSAFRGGQDSKRPAEERKGRPAEDAREHNEPTSTLSAQDVARRAGHAVGTTFSETMKKVHAEDRVLENEAETEKTPLERMQHALGVYNPDNLPDLYTQEAGVTKKGYSTTYTLSPARLLRKQKISGIALLPVLLCVVAAAIVANTIYGWADTNIFNANEQAQRKVSEQLATLQDTTLPLPATIIGQDDETIANTVMATDAQIYRAQSSDASVSLVLYRVPAGLDVASAQTEITQGVNKLAPADAVKLLNGLWQLEVTRANNTTAMRFKYADFKSGSVAQAVSAAMAQQGLTEDTVSAEGVDDSGNTYKEGTTTINDVETYWRISTVPLSDMYTVKGLPATAAYVGIRYSY